MIPRATWTRRVLVAVALAAVLAVAIFAVFWWKFLRSVDQSELASAEDRFKYGSLGAELVTGIPYPIFMVLPRVFPDLVERYAKEGFGPEKAGHGGWGAFGLAWDEGQRLPIGFSIKQVGFE